MFKNYEMIFPKKKKKKNTFIKRHMSVYRGSLSLYKLRNWLVSVLWPKVI